jgi:transcription initiation factor IIE alpha subunit
VDILAQALAAEINQALQEEKTTHETLGSPGRCPDGGSIDSSQHGGHALVDLACHDHHRHRLVWLDLAAHEGVSLTRCIMDTNDFRAMEEGLKDLLRYIPDEYSAGVKRIQGFLPHLQVELSMRERQAGLFAQQIESLERTNNDLNRTIALQIATIEDLTAKLEKQKKHHTRHAEFDDDTDKMVALIDSHPHRNWTDEEIAKTLDIAIADVNYHTTILKQKGLIDFDMVNLSRRFQTPGLESGFRITSSGVKYAFELRRAWLPPGFTKTTGVLLRSMPASSGKEFTEKEISDKTQIAMAEVETEINRLCDMGFVRPSSTVEPGYETRFELTRKGREYRQNLG